MAYKMQYGRKPDEGILEELQERIEENPALSGTINPKKAGLAADIKAEKVRQIHVAAKGIDNPWHADDDTFGSNEDLKEFLNKNGILSASNKLFHTHNSYLRRDISYFEIYPDSMRGITPKMKEDKNYLIAFGRMPPKAKNILSKSADTIGKLLGTEKKGAVYFAEDIGDGTYNVSITKIASEPTFPEIAGAIYFRAGDDLSIINLDESSPLYVFAEQGGADNLGYLL